MNNEDRQAINQVCSWAESARIIELETQLEQLRKFILFDWCVYSGVQFQDSDAKLIALIIKPIKSSEFEFLESLYYLRVDCLKFDTIQPVGIKYADSHISIVIFVRKKYALIVTRDTIHTRHNSSHTMTRERGEALIEYIESQRAL